MSDIYVLKQNDIVIIISGDVQGQKFLKEYAMKT